MYDIVPFECILYRICIWFCFVLVRTHQYDIALRWVWSLAPPTPVQPYTGLVKSTVLTTPLGVSQWYSNHGEVTYCPVVCFITVLFLLFFFVGFIFVFK